MWNILLKAPEASTVDTSSLKFGLSGAAPIPPEQLDECETRFNVPILEAYGLTESTGGITSNQITGKKPGSVGTPFKGLELKIVDVDGNTLAAKEVGEVVVKGAVLMNGYFNKPEETSRARRGDWLHTGDVGYIDDGGFLFLVDRIKDLIIRGGVNIFPKEIENVLLNHPKVDNIAVIPEPHEKYGKVPKACIVIKRGEECSEDEIREYCTGNMAEYKIPASISFRASLPANAVGKVLKQELIKVIAEEETAEAVPVAHLFEGMKDRFIPENSKGVEAAISYFITGKGGGQWTVTVNDGTIAITEEIVKSPRVYMVAGDKAYHDIATGVMDGLTAVLTGKMQIEGDINFMAEFRGMFKPL